MASSTQRSKHTDSLPYRLCVGIMVLNNEGLVWAGRRIAEGNTEYDGSPQLWQMPQGESMKTRSRNRQPCASSTRKPG
jgi:putative (di)nucleoside polyphosphate hydrolase